MSSNLEINVPKLLAIIDDAVILDAQVKAGVDNSLPDRITEENVTEEVRVFLNALLTQLRIENNLQIRQRSTLSTEKSQALEMLEVFLVGVRRKQYRDAANEQARNRLDEQYRVLVALEIFLRTETFKKVFQRMLVGLYLDGLNIIEEGKFGKLIPFDIGELIAVNLLEASTELKLDTSVGIDLQNPFDYGFRVLSKAIKTATALDKIEMPDEICGIVDSILTRRGRQTAVKGSKKIISDDRTEVVDDTEEMKFRNHDFILKVLQAEIQEHITSLEDFLNKRKT